MILVSSVLCSFSYVFLLFFLVLKSITVCSDVFYITKLLTGRREPIKSHSTSDLREFRLFSANEERVPAKYLRSYEECLS